jgi:PPOX class probable F420-dependent enzyme
MDDDRQRPGDGDALRRARYVSLATFRRSGVPVATPVWCAEDGGEFFVFSAGNAGKVKRLRNSSRARLAVCDARGGSVGEWHDADAFLVEEPAEVARALGALRRKYGWQMWLADAGARLTGRFDQRTYIRIRLAEAP